MTHAFQIGDHVWHGRPSPTKTTWQIEWLDMDRPRPMARLVSGLTGRHRYEVPLAELTLHTPATEGDAHA